MIRDRLPKDRLDLISDYMTRMFALENARNTKLAEDLFLGAEAGMERWHVTRKEFEAAVVNNMLQAWVDRRVSDVLWKRFLLAQRQQKFMSKWSQVTLRIDSETHRKLVKYCKKNNLTVNQAIEKLLAISKENE